MTVTVHHGDSREVLKGLPDASVHAVCTDPPYALVSIHKRFAKTGRTESTMPKAGPYARASAGFMGQRWDTGETAFDPDFWREVWRVLKPGGHVVAFSATRTYHRLACAIEDAGFEVRDMIAWLYGSGFPKSHDVSKGIDKAADYRLQAAVRRAAVDAVQAAGLKLPGNSKHDWTVGDHAPGDKWWAEFQAWLPGLSDTDRARVEGKIVQTIQKSAGWFTQGDIYSVRAPATAAARQWEGWGTALKPALEPIVFARKPLEGTVAANVLKHGVGALNIDACRIDAEDKPAGEYTVRRRKPGAEMAKTGGEGFRAADAPTFTGSMKPGRWPANVVLSYPEDEFVFRRDVTAEQRAEVYRWLSENA